MRSGGEAGIAVLLPGRTEFLEKYEEVGTELADRGFDVLCLDWRGQGLSSRLLANRQKGHIDNFDTYVEDLGALLLHTGVTAYTGRRILVAHSMAGLIASLFSLQRARYFDRVITIGPLWGVPLNVPEFAMMAAAKSAAAIGLASVYVSAGDYGPHSTVFDENIVTHDPRRWQRTCAHVETNPDLAIGGFTWGWLAAAFSAVRAARRDASRITAPWLIVQGGADKVVDNRAVSAFASAMPNPQTHTIEGAEHEILMEADEFRAQFWAVFDQFLLEPAGRCAAESG
jgi:lysophospholipase